MEVVVTTGAIRCAELLSNRHHQQTNSTPSFLEAGCPSCCPTNSVEAPKGSANSKIVRCNSVFENLIDWCRVRWCLQAAADSVVSTTQFAISNQYMIGDYVLPPNVVLPPASVLHYKWPQVFIIIINRLPNDLSSAAEPCHAIRRYRQCEVMCWMKAASQPSCFSTRTAVLKIQLQNVF